MECNHVILEGRLIRIEDKIDMVHEAMHKNREDITALKVKIATFGSLFGSIFGTIAGIVSAWIR